MGWDRKQGPRLVEQLLSHAVVADLANLQRNHSVVLAIERLDDAPLAADAQRPQRLVSPLDQRFRGRREVFTQGHGDIICAAAR